MPAIHMLPALLMALMSSWPCEASSIAAAQADNLHLASQLTIEPQQLQLGAEDWEWLRKKRAFTLGITGPSAPPLDITDSNGDYEGISADITALLKQQLGVEIKVRAFSDRTAALDALESGEVDMLSRTTAHEVDPQRFRLSRVYAANAPSMYRRQGDDRCIPQDLAEMKIAVVDGYLPQQQLKTLFPKAQIVPFKTNVEAMAALAFARADLYIGDTLSARYLINHSFFNYVKFVRFIDLQSAGYSFLLRLDNTRLSNILDAALASIGQLKMGYIVQRWAGGASVLPESKLLFNEQETRWLTQHPVVRLTINDDQAPMAFFDANDNFNGVVADLLEVVTQHTGLVFDVQRTGGFEDVQTALHKGEADLAILTSSPERQRLLRFSHSFATSVFSLVSRTGQPGIAGLAQLRGKRLAIAKGHVITASIHRDYPDIIVLEPATTLDALQMVQQGQADAALMAFSIARYYTARLYEKKLQVSGIVNGDAATANFAMRRSDTELQSILDKVILSIPPDELNAITLRWRANAAMSGQTWVDYRRVILEIIICALLILILTLMRIMQLRWHIKKRQAVQRSLNDQLQFLQTLNDAMPLPVYVRDREGRLLSFSRSYEQVMGMPPAHILGKTALEMPMDHFELALMLHNNYQQAMESGQPIQQRHTLQLDGQECVIDHWIQPFRDAGGVIKGVICGWQDVTQHQQLIHALQTAKQQADESSLAKTRFLATISHEIRTPMSAVIGTLELALKRADQGILDRDNIDVAHLSAKHLLELLGNTLDLVKIESGRLSFSPRRSCIKPLVESVMRVFEGMAQQQGLQLMLELDAGASREALIDPLRFKQVLSNLISNAIKFTRQGSVTVSVSCDTREAHSMAVVLQVKDTGVGISREDQARLFQPFAQVPNASLNAHSGSGLGLLISRSLSEMMGGRLEMHSTPGVGTTISVHLRLELLAPLPPPSFNPLPGASRVEDRTAQILIVDDNSLNRQMLKAQLEYLGYQAAEAQNGIEALALWRQASFDLIITDSHMPHMSGAELAQAIRRDEQQRGVDPTLILGLTADAQQEEIERGISAGMLDCLIKPVNLAMLEERLSSLQLDGHNHPSMEHEPQATEHDSAEYRSLQRLSGGSPRVAQQLMEELLRNNRNDLQQLRHYLKTMDLENLAELSHKLRGTAAILSHKPLIDLCLQLQQACDKRRDLVLERALDLQEELLRIDGLFSSTGQNEAIYR